MNGDKSRSSPLIKEKRQEGVKAISREYFLFIFLVAIIVTQLCFWDTQGFIIRMNSPKTSVEPSCVLTRLGFWKQTGHSVCVLCVLHVLNRHMPAHAQLLITSKIQTHVSYTRIAGSRWGLGLTQHFTSCSKGLRLQCTCRFGCFTCQM